MVDESSDVVVIGGGPAGLSAGLWLGRYRVPTWIVDAGDPRNAATWGVHGYPGLEDVPPMELRKTIRRQAQHAGACFAEGSVEEVEGERDRFRCRLSDGRIVATRRILLATGVRDIIPEIPGLLDFYGTSIWHCPDCDGPEAAGQRVGVIGWSQATAGFCLEMLTWTESVTVLTHGRPAEMDARACEALEHYGIDVRTGALERIEGEGGQVERVVFEGGGTLPFDALFFNVASGPGSPLAADLGCEADDSAVLQVDRDLQTSVPGVYAAGDLTPGARLAVRAAYEGVRAAIGIYKSLWPEERRI